MVTEKHGKNNLVKMLKTTVSSIPRTVIIDDKQMSRPFHVVTGQLGPAR